MPNKANTTLELTPQEKARLRQIAQDLGLTIKSGPVAGEGSIRRLLMAIAAGELKVEKP